MKRRFFLLLIILFIPCLSLFSLDLAAGAGLTITPYMQRIEVAKEGYFTAHAENNYVDMGFQAFFGAKYAELHATYYRTLLMKYQQRSFGYPLDLMTEYAPVNISYLDLALMGKIPISLENGGTFNFFGGFAYKLNLTSDFGYYSYSGDWSRENWDQMWIKVGGSYDNPMNKKIFTRVAFSLGFPLKNEDWKEMEKIWKDIMRQIGHSSAKTSYFGVGAELTLAIGYKIK